MCMCDVGALLVQERRVDRAEPVEVLLGHALQHNDSRQPGERWRAMAWDFSTEPEFQAQLDWMREFVREEIWPLETLDHELDQAELDAVYRPLQEQVQGARAVGRAPAARARRPGLRPGQARADARDPRHLAVRAERVRLPGAGLRQQRDPRARRHRRAEGALAASAAGRRPAVGLLDDRARHRRRRPDAAAHARGSTRRRRVGDQRPQVVLLQRVDRRLPDRHGGDRPRRAAAPARVDVHRPGRHARREHRARRPDDGAPRGVLRQARRPRRDPLRGRARPAPTHLLGARGRRLPDRPAPARPGPHPPLHALARRRRSARSTCSASARRTATRTAACSAEKQTVQNWIADSAAADAGRAADDAARRLDDGHRRARARPARTSR